MTTSAIAARNDPTSSSRVEHFAGSHAHGGGGEQLLSIAELEYQFDRRTLAEKQYLLRRLQQQIDLAAVGGSGSGSGSGGGAGVVVADHIGEAPAVMGSATSLWPLLGNLGMPFRMNSNNSNSSWGAGGSAQHQHNMISQHSAIGGVGAAGGRPHTDEAYSQPHQAQSNTTAASSNTTTGWVRPTKYRASYQVDDTFCCCACCCLLFIQLVPGAWDLLIWVL